MRTIQAIDEEYTKVAAELGHNVYLKEEVLPNVINKLKNIIISLNKEKSQILAATKLKENEDVKSPIKKKNLQK